jgi:hypothetical protein
MTLGGWFVMIVSVGSVTALFFWCLWKVFTTPEETEKLHGFSFETPDEAEENHPPTAGAGQIDSGKLPKGAHEQPDP